MLKRWRRCLISHRNSTSTLLERSRPRPNGQIYMKNNLINLRTKRHSPNTNKCNLHSTTNRKRSGSDTKRTYSKRLHPKRWPWIPIRSSIRNRRKSIYRIYSRAMMGSLMRSTRRKIIYSIRKHWETCRSMSRTLLGIKTHIPRQEGRSLCNQVEQVEIEVYWRARVQGISAVRWSILQHRSSNYMHSRHLWLRSRWNQRYWIRLGPCQRSKHSGSCRALLSHHTVKHIRTDSISKLHRARISQGQLSYLPFNQDPTNQMDPTKDSQNNSKTHHNNWARQPSIPVDPKHSHHPESHSLHLVNLIMITH